MHIGGVHVELYWIIVFFIFGVTFGSFFNVVGLRIPKNLTIIKDQSHCPHCNETLRWHELIPVLSFLWQKGLCRNCRARISSIYPVMEFVTGLLFAYSYFQFGFQYELMTSILLISLLVIIIVSDLTYMLIPNKIILFFLPLLVISRIIAPLTPWYDMILGAVVGYFIIALIIILSRGGMGAGDMKLFFILGIALGWKVTLFTLFLASLLGACIGLILLSLQRVERLQPIPFGPYIAIAAIISYFHGDTLISAYLQLFESIS